MTQYDIRRKVGLRVKELRMSRNITQEDFANYIDMARSYFAEVENGKRNIAVVNLEKITKGLDVTFVEFFDSDMFEKDKPRP